MPCPQAAGGVSPGSPPVVPGWHGQQAAVPPGQSGVPPAETGVSPGPVPGVGGLPGGSGDSRSVTGTVPSGYTRCRAGPPRPPLPFPTTPRAGSRRRVTPGADRSPVQPHPGAARIPGAAPSPPAATARPGPAQTVNTAGAEMWLLPVPPRARPRSRRGRPAPAQPRPHPPPPPSPAAPAGGTGSTAGTGRTGGTGGTRST